MRGARKNFADSREGSEVSLYHDVSTAPLLDLRRRLKLVANLLSAMIRDGVVILDSGIRWFLVFTVGSLTFFMLLLSVVGKLLFVVGGIGCVRILWLILISGCALIWFRLLPFCSVILLLLLGVLGFCLTP